MLSRAFCLLFPGQATRASKAVQTCYVTGPCNLNRFLATLYAVVWCKRHFARLLCQLHRDCSIRMNFFFRIRAQTEGEHRLFMGHIVFDYHSRCVPSPGRMNRHILCPRATPCMVLIFALAGTGKHVSLQLGCVDVYVWMYTYVWMHFYTIYTGLTITIRRGSRASLNCSLPMNVSAVEWEHSGGILKNGSLYTISTHTTHKKTKSWLIISKAEEKVAGNYTCRGIAGRVILVKLFHIVLEG